ncbi:MAG: hypothetical protein NTZ74_00900 [Chloroflexi bacterium]|nr:hypothetical protein [Chloroflexota bacterium]
MKTFTAKLLDLLSVNGEVCTRIESPPSISPRPGQYLLAFSNEGSELLPTALFPCREDHSGITYTGKLPLSWVPGMGITCRGPFGNGFHLPALAKRVALSSSQRSLTHRLYSLAEQALSRGAEVTLLSDEIITDLAPEIEVLPKSSSREVLKWADFVGLVSTIPEMQELKKDLSLDHHSFHPFPIEVMLDIPLACAGRAECGICGVSTRRGWKLGCKEGPVFSLDDLVDEDIPNG